MKNPVAYVLALGALLSCSQGRQEPSPALESNLDPLTATFGGGALILPTDEANQGSGILLSTGLVRALTRAGVPVRWVIKQGKALGDVDVSATVRAYGTTAVPTARDFRAGPFVIDAADAARAAPVIALFVTAHPTTVVLEATAGFTTNVKLRPFA